MQSPGDTGHVALDVALLRITPDSNSRPTNYHGCHSIVMSIPALPCPD